VGAGVNVEGAILGNGVVVDQGTVVSGGEYGKASRIAPA